MDGCKQERISTLITDRASQYPQNKKNLATRDSNLAPSLEKCKRLEPPARSVRNPPYGLDTGTNLLAPGVLWPYDEDTPEVVQLGVHEDGTFNHLTKWNLSTAEGCFVLVYKP